MADNYIVGFHSGHDCSYSILKNGQPIVHEELERISRVKEGVGDGLKFFFERNSAIAGKIKYFSHCHHYYGVRSLGDENLFDHMINSCRSQNGNFFEIGHHLSHAAHAFYSSKHTSSLIIVIDAGGWNYVPGGSITSSVSIWRGNNNKILPVEIFAIEDLDVGGLWHDSLGAIFNLSSGPPVGNQAGTIMAMAAAGLESPFVEEIYNSFSKPSSRQGLFNKLNNYIKEDTQKKYNIAKSIQEATELIIFNLLKRHISNEDINICFSGGVALNSVCMGKIYSWFPTIKSVYIPIVPYDGGLSIGSAQYIYYHIQNNKRSILNTISPYLGRGYSKAQVIKSLNAYNLIVHKEISEDKIIDLLIDNKIISIFNGRSESGRRALGNRSILASPVTSSMKENINQKVKHRQWFRPFAPSILAEETKNWFTMDVESPYMGLVIPFKDSMQSKVPAVVHLDGTGRLQTVTADVNLWYYNLIKKFFIKTGIPILLNTSFNDREPIVETPEHAIACFLNTQIDYLYFPEHNILVKKP